MTGNALAAGAVTGANSRLGGAKARKEQDTKNNWGKIDRGAKKRLIPMLEQQVVDLGGEPITLEDIKGMMMEEKEEGSVEEKEGGSVGLSGKKEKKPKKDKEQTKITSFMPKAAAHAGTTFLSWAHGVESSFMLLGGGGSKEVG